MLKKKTNQKNDIAQYFNKKQQNLKGGESSVKNEIIQISKKTYSKKSKIEQIENNEQEQTRVQDFLSNNLFKDEDDFEFSRTRKKINNSTSNKSTLIQTYLDFGQKNKGNRIICQECKMEYIVGKDEKEHKIFHRMKKKEEELCPEPLTLKEDKIDQSCKVYVDQHLEIEILRFTYTYLENLSKKNYIKSKIETLKKNITNELGSDSNNNQPKKTEQIYLLISKKKNLIIGALFVYEIKNAFRILKNSNSPTFSYQKSLKISVKCGVNRIWIHQNFRRKKYGTLLLNILRNNFLGTSQISKISKDEIAFTQPTQDGFAFFQNYIETDHFLVYDDSCL